MNYSLIFNNYTSLEGIPFTLKNRRVHFPDDRTLPIYKKAYIANNIAWTVLSYNIYGTIDHWWVLCALNKSNVLYAPADSEIYYIDENIINEVLAQIEDAR